MGWFDSSALATTTSTPPRATMKSQYTKGLMNDLHECCRIIAHTADDPVRSLQTLLAMCVNVYEHPDDERYRHIRLSNDRFHRRVWDVPGGRDACDRLGWVETVQHDGEPCVILPWNEKVPGAVCKYLRLAIEDALSDAEADYDDDARRPRRTRRTRRSTSRRRADSPKPRRSTSWRRRARTPRMKFGRRTAASGSRAGSTSSSVPGWSRRRGRSRRVLRTGPHTTASAW